MFRTLFTLPLLLFGIVPETNEVEINLWGGNAHSLMITEECHFTFIVESCALQILDASGIGSTSLLQCDFVKGQNMIENLCPDSPLYSTLEQIFPVELVWLPKNSYYYTSLVYSWAFSHPFPILFNSLHCHYTSKHLNWTFFSRSNLLLSTEFCHFLLWPKCWEHSPGRVGKWKWSRKLGKTSTLCRFLVRITRVGLTFRSLINFRIVLAKTIIRSILTIMLCKSL